MTKRRWQWLCIAAVVGTYVTSLFLPADCGIHMSGAEACLMFPQYIVKLLAGSTRLEMGTLLFGMLFYFCPNVLFVLGLLLLALRRYRMAVAAGLAAAACASYFFVLISWLNIGYYVWLGSILLLAATGGFLAVLRTDADMQVGTADSVPPALPDPSLLALFNQPQPRPLRPTEVRPAAPPSAMDSSTRPPCSLSS